jgi:integrase
MRRGEILRLRWQDVDLQNRFVTATSHKQSRQAIAVTRRINLPRELHQILQEHNQLSRRGQLVVTEPGTGKPISKSLSLRLFRQPLRNSRWCIDRKKSHYKIGYHTYRHSFASLLALKKVDQRIIDAYMGHTTEAMRKRYRHLFPDDRRAAVELLQFGVSMPSPDPTGR